MAHRNYGLTSTLSNPLLGYELRCAPVSEHLSLAVIKVTCDFSSLTQTVIDCLSSVTGVFQVHVDSLRHTIQILYDAELETMEDVHHVLIAIGWNKVNINDTPN